MDIRKPQDQNNSEKNQATSSQEPSKKDAFKAGIIQTADAKVMLPPAIQSKLSALTNKYGIPIDLSNIGLDGKMAENVKAMRSIVEMIEGDSKLLPEMFKLIRRLMKAEIKLAQFHKLVTREAIKHQQKFDKHTADIFLAMSGYQSKAVKLEHRTNVRNQLKEKRTEAYANYYNNSVYGEESKIIDAEYDVLESNKKILTASKTQQINFNAQRKQKVQQYVDSAFAD
jgi:hypothetical protein